MSQLSGVARTTRALVSSVLLFAAARARAGNFTVNSTLDDADPTLDGVCAAPPSGLCTLRAALSESQFDAADDQIHVPPGIYTILGPEIALTPAGGEVFVEGSGHAATRIRSAAARTGRFIFTTGDLSLQDLQIEQFYRNSSGGALASTGYLQVLNSAFVSNWSTQAGGSIYSTGFLDLDRVAFAGGHADNDGGEIYLGNPGYIHCEECIFEGATAGQDGGAIYLMYDTDGVIRESLFADNQAGGDGGAINSQIQGHFAAIMNSTFSGNRAVGNGGALAIPYLGLAIYSSTIVGNTADLDLNGVGDGGGIWYYVNAGNELANSIVSGNSSSVTVTEQRLILRWAEDCAGPVTSTGKNLVQNFFTGCAPGDNGCCVISGSAPLRSDPQLGPLVYNGGTTRTHAIAPGSPAIDAGDPAGCYDPENTTSYFDQRGAPRSTLDAPLCDLGSFEYGPLIFNDDFELWEWKWSGVQAP